MRRYRHTVLKPIFMEFDRRQFFVTASVVLPGFGVSPLRLGLMPLPLQWERLPLEAVPLHWKHSRAWSLVRVTGRWPLPIFGLVGLPAQHRCVACAIEQATVVHVLCHCPATASLYQQLTDGLDSTPQRSEATRVLAYVFGTPQDQESWCSAQRFVGEAFAVALAMQT